MLRAIAAAAAVSLLIGCTQTSPYRTQVPGHESKPATWSPPDPSSASIERHVASNGDEFYIGVVEFDDQGWFQNAQQLAAVMKLLSDLGDEQDVIISVFVHGWKHGASYCDPNIACFREMLDHIVRSEREYHRQLWSNKPVRLRKVVGIYVGWRGLSLEGPDMLRNLSFWDRKAVATQVAQGSVRELFARIRNFQVTHNDRDWIKAHLPNGGVRAEHPRNRLFIIGHSFGGLVVYTSVAQYLLNSLVGSPGHESDPVDGFGDMVILVNPAFEGSRYEPLHQAAQGRRYAKTQEPVFIAITSTDDLATKDAFPVGRAVSTVLEKYSDNSTLGGGQEQRWDTHTEAQQKESSRHTIGHVDRYVTHVLGATDGAKLEALPPEKKSDCGCPYSKALERAGSVRFREESDRRDDFENQYLRNDLRVPAWERQYVGDITLKQRLTNEAGETLNPNAPFWVVKTATPIISGHNEFWTPSLLNFLRQAYDDQLRTKDDQARKPGDPLRREALKRPASSPPNPK